jgi:hypothetical protein
MPRDQVSNWSILTKSSQVWSTELPKNILSQANAKNQQVAFDATKSSTFKRLEEETWKISYGDQSSASGDVGTDVVDLGGLKVENQAVELAKELSQQFATVSNHVRVYREKELTEVACRAMEVDCWVWRSAPSTLSPRHHRRRP